MLAIFSALHSDAHAMLCITCIVHWTTCSEPNIVRYGQEMLLIFFDLIHSEVIEMASFEAW